GLGQGDRERHAGRDPRQRAGDPGLSRRRGGRPGDEGGVRHMTAVVEVQDLWAGYAGVPVVRNLSLRVDAGEVVALLGPNGAGKTTTLTTIAGLIPCIGGRVALEGEDLAGIPTHRLARRAGSPLPPGPAPLFRR